MAKKQAPKQLSPENYIRQKARNLPLFECLINKDWKENGMATISVARRHANGNITAGLYLVDLQCLGVKDSFSLFNIEEDEYVKKVVQRGNLTLENIPYVLAHNIIFAAVEFASEFGFKAHKEFELSRYILEADTEAIELIEIECGKDGKPMYVQGPHDSEQKVRLLLAQLERTAGAGNYHFIVNHEVINDDYEEQL
jgi:hypothetical protein